MLGHMTEVIPTRLVPATPAAPDPAPGHACDAGLRRAFDFLGKRWNGVILATLAERPVGFSDLRRSVGSITDSVLSDRLTELTAAGLVERTVTDGRPPGVNYQLSTSGRGLLPILQQLGDWARDHLGLSDC
jgi:DNA-binding HxlR family transcriptional regulator